MILLLKLPAQLTLIIRWGWIVVKDNRNCDLPLDFTTFPSKLNGDFLKITYLIASLNRIAEKYLLKSYRIEV